mgnify:CR=1 FL=1
MTEEVEVKVREVVESGKEAGSTFVEGLRKLLLAGIGAVALSRDETETFVNKLVERGVRLSFASSAGTSVAWRGSKSIWLGLGVTGESWGELSSRAAWVWSRGGDLRLVGRASVFSGGVFAPINL